MLNSEHKISKRDSNNPIDISAHRHNFFEVPDGQITKSFIFPSTTSTQVIKSLSMSEWDGLAIGESKEIIITN